MNIRVEEVFTPTKPARSTFVEREAINDRLVAALRTPGKQIVVYGHTGSGKTTLLVNKLQQLYECHITTRCYSAMSFNDILLDGFDRLGTFYDAEKAQTRQWKVSPSLQAEYLKIKATIGGEFSSQSNIKRVRVLPPQLTPQTLATFLGDAKSCWVLEDFHKIEPQEKKKLAQVMKLFMDMSDQYNDLKIIAIGAVDTARQVIEYDNEMRNRISEILVPLMSDQEIKLIPEKGEQLLNVFIEENVKERIVSLSDGLAAVCHHLCLNLCYTVHLYQTSETQILLGPKEFESALGQYLEESSDTLKYTFDRAMRKLPSQDFNDAELIIRSLLSLGREGGTKEEILALVILQELNYDPRALGAFLRKLTKRERGQLLRLDEASGRFSFADSHYRIYALTYFEREKQRQSATIRETGVPTESVVKAVRQFLKGKTVVRDKTKPK